MSSMVLTKDHYDFIKSVEAINDSLRNCVNNFVEVGFRLESIKNNKSYELVGYKSFEDFAKTEFSLGSTSCKNYIAIARRFGDEKNLSLLKKYEKYSLSQLTELLSVNDDSIDNYSPSLTTKQMRTLKVIGQSTDYKEKFKKWVQFYVDENKDEINGYFKLRTEVYSRSIYFYSPLSKYSSFYSVSFYDGYFHFKDYQKKIYDLDFERFQELFKKEFLKALKSEAKNIEKANKDEAERKQKEKADYEASLPENQPGLTDEERIILHEERINNEKYDKYVKELYKIKRYNFNPYYADKILTYNLFTKFNLIDYTKYPLVYTKNNFVGLVNGLTHIRFYDDHVEVYDLTKKEFETIITIGSLRIMIGQIFSGEHFTNLINLNPEDSKVNKKCYLQDLVSTINDVNDKRFGFND